MEKGAGLVLHRAVMLLLPEEGRHPWQKPQMRIVPENLRLPVVRPRFQSLLQLRRVTDRSPKCIPPNCGLLACKRSIHATTRGSTVLIPRRRSHAVQIQTRPDIGQQAGGVRPAHCKPVLGSPGVTGWGEAKEPLKVTGVAMGWSKNCP